MRASIKARLITLLALLGALCVGSTILGNVALYKNHQSLRTVFDDRLLCLSQFSQIRDSYEVILRAMRNAVSREIGPEEAAKIFRRELARAKEVWAAYTATAMSREESGVAGEVAARLRQNEAIVEDPLRRLDRGEAVDFAATRLTLLAGTGPTNVGLAKLTEMQVGEARAEFERATALAWWLRALLLVALGITVAAVAYGLVVILVHVMRPIGMTTATMSRLAAGDLDAPVLGAGRRDEIGAMARAVQVFKDALIAKRASDAAAAIQLAEKARRATTLERATDAFRDQVERMVRTLARAAGEMEAAARLMSRNADQTAAQSLHRLVGGRTYLGQRPDGGRGQRGAGDIDRCDQRPDRPIVRHGGACRRRRDGDQFAGHRPGRRRGADRNRHQPDFRHRGADQPARPQRHHRGGPRRRGGPRLRGGGRRSQGTGQPDRQGHRDDLRAGRAPSRARPTARSTPSSPSRPPSLDLRTIAVGVAASMEQQGVVTQEIVRNVTQAADGTHAVTVNIAAVTEAAGETGTAANRVLAAATELSRQSEDLGDAVADFLATVQAA